MLSKLLNTLIDNYFVYKGFIKIYVKVRDLIDCNLTYKIKGSFVYIYMNNIDKNLQYKKDKMVAISKDDIIKHYLTNNDDYFDIKAKTIYKKLNYNV